MDYLLGETPMRNRLKKVRGFIPHIKDEGYDSMELTPFLAALSNPDILSDEEGRMFPERDFDEEEVRAEYIEKFKLALTKLTPKQRAILDAMERLGDQQKVADEIGIARVTVAVVLMRIAKKITKSVNKLSK